MRLIVFADYVCPYCYLAETQLARLRAGDAVAMEPAAFELYPAGAVQPEPDAAWLLEAWDRSVLPLAAGYGATMARPSFIPRTRKAHEAVAYAASEGAGVALHEALYRAYWQDGRDIGRIDVLVEVGAGVGLDRTGLKVALDIDQWTERVEQDVALATRLRLDGVPAYLLLFETTGDGPQVAADLRVGLQPHDELRRWVTGRHDVREDDGRADT
ncbi:MAG TPA: DsbA family protein [Longimicrobiales bacterium]|nr:DsbA family protein [Longimicrobiales bacterium]